MDLRIFTEPQQGADYATLLLVAQATERLGFDAFFRSDHYLTIGGSGLPGPTDAWITLAGLARETSRIRLGTLMSPVTFRLPGRLYTQRTWTRTSVARLKRPSGIRRSSASCTSSTSSGSTPSLSAGCGIAPPRKMSRPKCFTKRSPR